MGDTFIPSRCVKRLQKELILFEKEPVPNVAVKPDTNNMLKWYFVLYGIDDDQYRNGIYLGEIRIPNDYPMKAPSMRMLTPSGRFNISEDICTTFTDYHQEQWSPKWTIQGICIGFTSFMLDDEGRGVGSISRTKEERKDYAKKSKAYNLKNYKHIFDELFPDLLS